MGVAGAATCSVFASSIMVASAGWAGALPYILFDVAFGILTFIPMMMNSVNQSSEQKTQSMSDGRLTAGHARAILAVPSDEGRIRLAEKVVAENLSVRQTESLAPLFSGGGGEPAKREPLPQSFKRAARQLRIALDTNVKVKKVRGKNKIEIEFASDEELSKIVDLLSGEE